MLLSKLSTQRMIDAGRHRVLVYVSLVVLVLTMASYVFLETGAHLLIAGFFFGLGYGILQSLFQSFVTGTTPKPKRGVANATYLLSYDIGIGIGALLMGFMQETIGLTTGFALTAIAYVVGGILYAAYAEGYYRKLRGRAVVPAEEGREGVLLDHMERQVYTLPTTATVRDAIMDCGVLEVGVKRTITIPDHATLEEACRLLSEAGVKKVPVVCGDKVVGILSRSGLTGYLIRRYLDRTNTQATAAIPAGQDQ